MCGLLLFGPDEVRDFFECVVGSIGAFVEETMCVTIDKDSVRIGHHEGFADSTSGIHGLSVESVELSGGTGAQTQTHVKTFALVAATTGSCRREPLGEGAKMFDQHFGVAFEAAARQDHPDSLDVTSGFRS
jgi:hypothetical protein